MRLGTRMRAGKGIGKNEEGDERARMKGREERNGSKNRTKEKRRR